MKLTYKTLCAPISVHLELTEHCHNRCIHCYNQRRGNKTTMASLDRPQLDDILDQLIASDVLLVTITGGEPLLCKENLLHSISRLTAAGIDVHLNSSLMLLDKPYAQELQQAGLHTILASLLSWKSATHTLITRNPASFHKTVQGIRQAVESGLRVAVNMVVSALNVDDIYQTAVFVQQLGVQRFAATKMALSSSNRAADPFRLTREQVQSSLEVLEQAGADAGIAVESLACYPFCLLKDLERFRRIARRRCGAGKTTCTISARGDVRPCSFADLSYGSILTTPFSTIWQRMSAWRQFEYIAQECQHCRYLAACGGGCRMEAKYSGDIYGPDPYMLSPEAVKPAPLQSPLTLVPADQPLFFPKGLKLREEAFGGVVYCHDVGIVPVDHDHFKLLRRIMPQGSFTATEIAVRGEHSLEHLQRFFSWLAAQGFLITDKRG